MDSFFVGMNHTMLTIINAMLDHSSNGTSSNCLRGVEGENLFIIPFLKIVRNDSRARVDIKISRSRRPGKMF